MKPKIPAPPPLPETPKIYTPNDNELEDARRRAIRKAGKRGGRDSTRLAEKSQMYTRTTLG